jgi:ABC-type transport system involved in multi-copper enzyme maturation permease subunit
MNKGWTFRYRLMLKHWFTSIYGWGTILIAFIGYSISDSQTSTAKDFISTFYEQGGTLLVILIISWVFSLDFDSKYIRMILSYPQRRTQFIFERALFGYVLFLIVIIIFTVYIQWKLVPDVWKFILFILPSYLFIGMLVIMGTIITNHSIGGLFLGLLFWAIAMLKGGGEWHPTILHFSGVYQAAESMYVVAPDHWVVYNRIGYILSALLLLTVSSILFRKKGA